MITDPHSILARWRKHFCQILNVYWFSDVRPTEIHTTPPLVPEPGALEFEMTIENIKRHKSPSIDQIPAELIKTGRRTIRYDTHKLIYSISNGEELPAEWKESIIVPVYKNGDKMDISNYRGISLCQPRTKIYPTFCCQG